ncbi:MAG: response regulator [Desulfosporosinus sp.]|nr:response regulator [Desulfosporosinus sp.]
MGKILIVDDQFGLRCLLFETFREDQHEVEMVSNGTESLQLIVSFKPDLILMDMKMPGMNGIETLRQIRTLDRRVAVIMMTGYGDIQNIQQTNDLGIFDYITKPFDLFELRERVSEILNRSVISGVV